MDNLTIPTKFDVCLYGNLEQLTPTLSKCRVRTFYKGFNRNRTFISEEFAQQLIDSMPYAPIKGIFDPDSDDYTDHGKDNTDGKIYGVVMADPNFAWEEHLDDDGVTRTYACVDAIIYTGLYPEASLIKNKPQSMEIFKGNLVGEWRTWQDGKLYYHFLKGCLVGLQILGDEVEPCFEGAAFFSLYKDAQEVISYIKSLQDKEGNKVMDNEVIQVEETKVEDAITDSYDKFRLSDRDKAIAIERAINADGDRYFVFDVYDDYALCRDYQDEKFVRVYYTKTEDSVVVGEMVDVVMVDITHDEEIALEAIKAAAGTYELASEQLGKLAESTDTTDVTLNDAQENQDSEQQTEDLSTELSALKESFALLEAQIAEKDNLISDFTSREEEWAAEKVKMKQAISDITNENESLTSFKKQIELEKKEAILTKYEEHLSDSIYQTLKDSIDKFSIEDFNKEVCTAVVEAGTDFLKEDRAPALISKNNEELTITHLKGAESILAKYVKNGGKK